MRSEGRTWPAIRAENSTRKMFSPLSRVVHGRIHVLACSVSFGRSDWTTTTGSALPAPVPRRGFKSADHSSPRRGKRSGIVQPLVHQGVRFAYRLERRGSHPKRGLAELSAQLLTR